MELGALDQLKIFFTIQNILMTRWLSGERSLPFGLLVFCFVVAIFDLVCDVEPIVMGLS